MTLSKLIKSIMARDPERKLSYRDLEALAADLGFRMGWSHFHYLCTTVRLRRLPDDKTLQTLAAMAAVPLEQVRHAALRSLGWKVTPPCPLTGGCIVLAAESLTAQEIEKVRASAERTKRRILANREREHSTVAG